RFAAERFRERDRVGYGLRDSARGVRPRHGGGVAQQTDAPAAIARHAEVVDRLQERLFGRGDDLLDVTGELAAELPHGLDPTTRAAAGYDGRRLGIDPRIDAPIQTAPPELDFAFATRHEVERAVPARIDGKRQRIVEERCARHEPLFEKTSPQAV